MKDSTSNTPVAPDKVAEDPVQKLRDFIERHNRATNFQNGQAQISFGSMHKCLDCGCTHFRGEAHNYCKCGHHSDRHQGVV